MSGLRWSAGVRFGSQIFTWAVTLLVVRLLSPSDYGLLAMAMVFVGFLSMIAEFGLGPAVVQRVNVDEGELRKAFGIILLVHGSLFLLLFFSAPLIGILFGEPRLPPVVRILSVLFLVAAFQVMPDALLQRRMEFRRRSINDFAAVVAGSLTTLFAALGGWNVWALVAGTFVTQLWKVIGLNFIAPFLHKPDFSLRGTRGMLQFGGHLTATQILWFFATQVDVLIAGRWLGKELLGFYSVAMHLASLPNQRIGGIINQVAFPAFSRMQHDRRQVNAAVMGGIRVLSFFAFPILWGISSVAPEFVSVVLGSKWAQSTLPIQILALIMPLRMIGNFVPNAVQGIGRSDVVLGNIMWVAPLMPVAFLIGVHWGLFGLCMAWLAIAPVAFVGNLHQNARALGFSLTAALRTIAPAAASALTMYAAVAITRHLLPSEISNLITLPILIISGAITYALAALAFNRRGCLEVLAFVRELGTVESLPGNLGVHNDVH